MIYTRLITSVIGLCTKHLQNLIIILTSIEIVETIVQHTQNTKLMLSLHKLNGEKEKGRERDQTHLQSVF